MKTLLLTSLLFMVTTSYAVTIEDFAGHYKGVLKMAPMTAIMLTIEKDGATTFSYNDGEAGCYGQSVMNENSQLKSDLICNMLVNISFETDLSKISNFKHFEVPVRSQFTGTAIWIFDRL